MSERLVHAAVGLMKLSLWLLSTWFGTFILCGRLSLCNHFPFFRRFSQILQPRREEILLSWSHSSWYLFRLLFKGIKFLCCLAFYTKVRIKNPSLQVLLLKSDQVLEDEKNGTAIWHHPFCISIFFYTSKKL